MTDGDPSLFIFPPSMSLSAEKRFSEVLTSGCMFKHVQVINVVHLLGFVFDTVKQSKTLVSLLTQCRKTMSLTKCGLFYNSVQAFSNVEKTLKYCIFCSFVILLCNQKHGFSSFIAFDKCAGKCFGGKSAVYYQTPIWNFNTAILLRFT